MSIDLKTDVIAPEVQALLDAFDRLSEAAKCDALGRLLQRSPEPRSAIEELVDVDGLDWGEITEVQQALLAAEAFAAMDRDEEDFASGDRRRLR